MSNFLKYSALQRSQQMDGGFVSKWGSEGYGVDRRCGVAEVKGVAELLGSTGTGGNLYKACQYYTKNTRPYNVHKSDDFSQGWSILHKVCNSIRPYKVHKTGDIHKAGGYHRDQTL